MMNDSAQNKSPLKGRLVLLLLFGIFFLPVAGALFLNVKFPHWLPFGRTNHGTLITPVERFDVSGLERVDGGPLDPGFIAGKWTLVHVERGACLADCDRVLYVMRQARRAMGKDMDRVQRLMVAAAGQASAVSEKLQAHDAALDVAVADAAWFESARPAKERAVIYLVDPEGRLVMWYGRDLEPGGLIDDLQRLLRISKIG